MPQDDAQFDLVLEILRMVETIAANQRCVLAEPMVRAAAAGMVCVQKLILDDDSS